MTPDSLRVKLWREANRERYNANQRELMKARRASKKLEAKKEPEFSAPAKQPEFTVEFVPYSP